MKDGQCGDVVYAGLPTGKMANYLELLFANRKTNIKVNEERNVKAAEAAFKASLTKIQAVVDEKRKKLALALGE